MPSCATLPKSSTCVGRQRRRGFAWTLWRTKLWTTTCSSLCCYNPDFEKQKPEFLKPISEKMKLYSEFLGKQPWFAGDKITYVDFLAYDILDQHHIFEPKCLDAFPYLKDFLACFEGLKKISACMKSSCFIPTRIFSKMAQWSNK
ncbi:glutathione S-transferase Mu 1 [Sigmodon hispidus]